MRRVLSFLGVGGLALTFFTHQAQAKGQGEKVLPRDRLASIEEAIAREIKKGEKKKEKEEAEMIPIASPYRTTEEFLLPPEVGKLRRAFTTTDPLAFGGRVVEEEALFEELSRRDEESLYYLAEAVEEKPLWRRIVETMAGVIQYEQGLYTNYFNDRARHDLWTEKPFFALRTATWGVLSIDANYFVSLERLSFERNLSLDPHILKTHGGQVRALYRPARRIHLLFSNSMRASDKIVAVDNKLNERSIGSNNIGNNIGTVFRYFLTNQDVITVTFDYDYSRARFTDNLQIARGYKPKISFTRRFGRRLILRGFWTIDFLNRKASGAKTTSFRHEPGVGGTFVLGKRLVLDVDYARQFTRPRHVGGLAKGHRIGVTLNNQLTRRLTQSYNISYSKEESKRTAVSQFTDIAEGSRFGSWTLANQLTYQLTPLTKLVVTLDFTRAKSGPEPNNRKRILAVLTRPLIRNRLDLKFEYTYEKNDGSIASSFRSHVFLLSLKSLWGAGK